MTPTALPDVPLGFLLACRTGNRENTRGTESAEIKLA